MAVSEPWVDCLLEEYFMQSDREKSEGLPVAPFMDRDKVTKPSAQIGFIKYVLIPLFDATTKVSVCVHMLPTLLMYPSMCVFRLFLRCLSWWSPSRTLLSTMSNSK